MYEKEYYRPHEIAQLGLITNSTGGDNVASNYKHILQLIKTGNLKARNYGLGSRPYYMVKASEIERYRQEIK